MAKSSKSCKGGCKIGRAVDKSLIAKELARWKREQKKHQGQSDVMRAATSGVIGLVPDPPISKMQCMSDWYRARMAATEIDRLEKEEHRIAAALVIENEKLQQAIQDLADCVGGVLV